MIGIYKGGRVLVATLLIAAAFGTAGVALTAATATPAYAVCLADPIVGTWHNINSNTPAMTQAVISHDCPGAYHAHMFGRTPWLNAQCACDWGTVEATDMGNGQLLATYNFGFSGWRSFVWLKTYDYYGRTYLRVYVQNQNFSGDGRPNYVTDEWFLK